MRKLFTILIFFLAVGVYSQTLQWAGNSYIPVLINGSSTQQWFNGSATFQPDYFDGYTFNNITSLKLGAELETWESGTADNATLAYEVRNTSNALVYGGTLDVPFLTVNGNNDKWQEANNANFVEVINGGLLTAGTTYYLNVWFYATDTAGPTTVYDSNGGANFVATVVTDAALPVELSSFTAIVAQNEVQLNWKTATEVNNYGFEIQKSNDNQNFETLAFVEGHGNSNSVKSYSYADNKVADGKYYYRLKQINSDGTFDYSETISAVVGIAETYSLLQNYPNPFNPTTTIQFNLPENSVVSLKVFNALGQQVADLANGLFEAGIHKINFNASELNSGIYFYQIKTNNFTQVRKMMLVK